MASILYALYGIAALIVAAIGLLWIGFRVPGPGSEEPRYQALTVLGVLFVVVMVGLFIV